ncbi:NAD(P)H-binding protein [Streptomyces sp. NPDC020875]|uniref:NAD(P)H-binding protein n=1 Tax=Streptomyces sp. NPDC020875 TaxID=3154898 RepID=UPI0033D9E51B
MTTSSTSASAVRPASVLVLGGTGKTGRRVADELRRRGRTAVVASRSGGEDRPGTVRFDWADPSTWEPALDGVDAVYVVDSQGPDAPAEVRAFVELAGRSGVRRLVLLSARVWGELDVPGALDTENAVREAAEGTGLGWTILRPTWFSQNFTELEFFVTPLRDGELRLPTGDGRESFVDLDDLAEVAAVALTEDGHAGRTYTLSGPKALSFGEAVAELAAATGRRMRFVPVTEDEFRAELAAGDAEAPPEGADIYVTLFRHIREERGAAPADGVREALGREPRDFSDYVATVAPAHPAARGAHDAHV